MSKKTTIKRAPRPPRDSTGGSRLYRDGELVEHIPATQPRTALANAAPAQPAAKPASTEPAPAQPKPPPRRPAPSTKTRRR